MRGGNGRFRLLSYRRTAAQETLPYAVGLKRRKPAHPGVFPDKAGWRLEIVLCAIGEECEEDRVVIAAQKDPVLLPRQAFDQKFQNATAIGPPVDQVAQMNDGVSGGAVRILVPGNHLVGGLEHRPLPMDVSDRVDPHVAPP